MHDELRNAIRGLTENIKNKSGSTIQPRYNLELVMGKALSMQAGNTLVRVELYDGTTMDVNYLAPYIVTFQANDTVLMLKWGPTYVVLGDLV